jgi:hypothetical protein
MGTWMAFAIGVSGVLLLEVFVLQFDEHSPYLKVPGRQEQRRRVSCCGQLR